MSKSLGNVLLVRDLLKEAPGEAIRYALLSAHYRQPLDWTPETPKAARAALDRLYGALRDQPVAEPSPGDMAPVLAALDDDLNTPAAFAALHTLAAQFHSEADPRRRAQIAAGLRKAGSFLGLLQQDLVAWAHAGAGEVDQIEALVAKRAQARLDHDWQRADELRDRLLALGVEVEDSCGESRWRMRA